MPENENDMQPTTETPVAPTTATPAEKKRQPKVKDRSIEELQNVASTKMTDSEKNQYIHACRCDIEQLKTQNAALDKNCQSAFEQYRNAIDNNAKLIAKFNEDMAFICSAAHNFNKTIQMIGGSNK